MKKLNLFDKFVFFLNSILATTLLLSYILPYIEPERSAFVSVLSLTVPFLIIVNILFLIYWLLRIKKQLLLSLIVLLIGFNHMASLYKFSASKQVEDKDNIAIMNYNVRLFNVFNWLPNKNITAEITAFIKERNPDIISMQEYRQDSDLSLKDYYKFEVLSGNKVKNGQAIFSKFPIINKGSIEFPNTDNNAIFVDVVRAEDTIRIYNVHLQSLKIDASTDPLKNETSENLFKRVGNTFRLQQMQADLFLEHKAASPYKVIICGDFNNTAYSYVYNTIKGDDLKDAFVEAGNGFGRSFDFKFFPVRIDFIMVDESFIVNSFKTFDVKLSDHFPIISRVKVK
ncbi:endonuclease/exonuclease/phosphatase family protein [Gelidibacter salicanalis]|uniref:Endonuclease/exonuclease/phosphatase family protein n=1 Tax=Gelidibacter salicanalis TaxID=291193 RepID=A0A5C7AC29_9FLAO|nr:endonuclease/exonuclease/phosphatase family protein [Gelidibacter salicanalis]TXE05797.1 endonuclease/exonuclease/phosphatase family protein [Gelidibacter salicanalis]